MIIKQFEKFKVNENNENKEPLNKKIKNIIDMVEINSSFKKIDIKPNEVKFISNKNGDKINKKHSVLDIDEARKVIIILDNNFNDINVNIKTENENVIINVIIKKYIK